MGPQLPGSRASSPFPTPWPWPPFPARANLCRHHTHGPAALVRRPGTRGRTVLGDRLPPSVPLSLPVGESCSGPRTQAGLRTSSSASFQPAG